MRGLTFSKMVASGNDFLVADIGRVTSLKLRSLAKAACDRKYGVGADGLLALGKSKRADLRMRIFNADGSEAEMCGNGARCVAQYASRTRRSLRRSVRIETKAGIIESEILGNTIRIKLTDPKDIKLNIPLRLGDKWLRANFINTGVPHAVVFVEGLEKLDTPGIGRMIRYHRHFKPAGANVDFVECIGSHSIRIRTYERGVEDETLACGTGSVAAALIFALKTDTAGSINVLTQSKEILKVYFKRADGGFHDVWLEGAARVICTGEYFYR